MLYSRTLSDFYTRSKWQDKSNELSSIAKHGKQPGNYSKHFERAEKAGLIIVALGTGGAKLAKNPEEISLYDIYHALEPDGLTSIIGIHDCGQRNCPVAQNIAYVLKDPYEQIEESIKKTMKAITLQNLIDRFQEKVST